MGSRMRSCFPQETPLLICCIQMTDVVTSEYGIPLGDRTTLHMHCLDIDESTPPGSTLHPGAGDARGGARQKHAPLSQGHDVTKNLEKDLRSLTAFTDGFWVSWGRRRKSDSRNHSILHHALSPLMRGCSDAPDFCTGKSISASVSRKQATVHHSLEHNNPYPSSRVQKYLMDVSVTEDKPTVCLVVNGGRKVLKMALYALEHDIPVIAMKNSGGYADVLASDDFRKDKMEKAGIEECVKRFVDGVELTEDIVDIVVKIYDTFRGQLTVYNPSDQHRKHLDRVILDALLQSQKYHQAQAFLQTLQRKSTERAAAAVHTGRDQGHSDQTANCCVQDRKDVVNVLLQCLSTHQPSASAVIVRTLKIDYTAITMITFKRLMELYSKSHWPDRSDRSRKKTRKNIFSNRFLLVICNECRQPNHGNQPQSNTVEDRGVGRYRQLREELHRHTRHLVTTPLGCPGAKNCKRCQEILETGDAASNDTCLKPAQELFLWSLNFGNQDLTEALLEHVQDKMAACLFAFAFYTGKANEENQNVHKQTLRDNASHFEELARLCLQNCYEKDRDRTVTLLLRSRLDWGDFSTMKIAIMTKCMGFVAEDAYQARLEEIWHCMDEEAGFALSPFNVRDDVIRLFTPAVAYGLSFVCQLLFLLLFSYVLLFDLHTSLTWRFLVLAFYVADMAADEIRQFLMGSPILRPGCSCNPVEMVRTFASEMWNLFDLVAIGLFALGLLVFVDNEVAYVVGRIALSLDALAFFLRFLQMLLYFEDLGIFLVMAQKSLRDTGYFVMILLTVMLGYVVSSHGMMFPPPNNVTSTWTYLLDLPFKGYWQTFSLDPESISVCQAITKSGLEDGECPTESMEATHYGHYMSSVLLALYLMFINVLLMNLLIAKFNNTFKEVYREAKLHQSWQKCQLITEYYMHTPAPFSTISTMLSFVILIQAMLVTCVKVVCQNLAGQENSADEEREEREMSTSQTNHTTTDPELKNAATQLEREQMKKAIIQAGEAKQDKATEVTQSLERQMVHVHQQLDQLTHGLQQLQRCLTRKPRRQRR